MLPWLGSGLEDLRYTLFHVPQLVTFRRLAIISIFAADARFHTVGDLVAFLPTGLAHALYAPFPWQWLSAGDAGVFKALSRVETLLTVALTPFVVLGIWRGVQAPRFEAATLVITGLILLVALAVTVPNVGTLFRLRLQALVPLLVVASAYGLPAGLRSRWSRGLAHRR